MLPSSLALVQLSLSSSNVQGFGTFRGPRRLICHVLWDAGCGCSAMPLWLRWDYRVTHFPTLCVSVCPSVSLDDFMGDVGLSREPFPFLCLSVSLSACLCLSVCLSFNAFMGEVGLSHDPFPFPFSLCLCLSVCLSP